MARISSRVIRPLGPVPATCCRSTPTSRAKRRTAGPAATWPPSWVGSGRGARGAGVGGREAEVGKTAADSCFGRGGAALGVLGTEYSVLGALVPAAVLAPGSGRAACLDAPGSRVLAPDSCSLADAAGFFAAADA